MRSALSFAVRPIKGFLLPMLIMALLVSNVLSITDAGFHQLLWKGLASLPFEGLLSDSLELLHRNSTKEASSLRKSNTQLRTEIRTLKSNSATRLSKARQISKGITRRIKRNLLLNTGSLVGEAIPIIGIGLIAAVTAADLKAGCDNAQDIQHMLVELGVEDQDLEHQQVCGMSMPTVDEIKDGVSEKVGGTIYSAIELITEKHSALKEATGGTIFEIRERWGLGN